MKQLKQIKKGIFVIYLNDEYQGAGYWTNRNLKDYKSIFMYDEQNFPIKQKESEVYDLLKTYKEETFG